MHEKYWQQLGNRSASSNKYDFGHVLVIGGSEDTAGAPLLAAWAALKIGAGLVTVASIPAVISRMDGAVPELLTHEIPSFSPDQVAPLRQYILSREVSVIAIGPGLGKDAAPFVHSLLQEIHTPCIIDAGALTAYAQAAADLAAIAKDNPDLVLTPHPGEFVRLTGEAFIGTDAQDEAAAAFAVQNGVTLVLKHDRTLIAHPDGSSTFATTGNPGLATAGTGDVLTGIIAGLIAQHIPTGPATEMAVHIHGLAADQRVKTSTQPGMTASEVIDQLPTALLDLTRS